MTKVRTFANSSRIGLENDITKLLKGKKIIHASLCTNEEAGITRDSPKKTYYVALVTYEEG